MPTEPTIWLARPRGFCAGVCRALATIEAVLANRSRPIYVNHEIVHNDHVADDLRSRGVAFANTLADVPDGATLIISAHGVAADFMAAARNRGLQVIDATCPLVEKVHHKARRAVAAGKTVILIGHRGHPEVVGTLGQVAPDAAFLVESPADVAVLPNLDSKRITVLTQTTLTPEDIAAVTDALVRRFPGIQLGDDLCYATRNRQQAVRDLAGHCPLILVVGSPRSSNSRRLVEVAQTAGVKAFLVQDAGELREEWLEGAKAIGITAAASTPECLVEQLLARLRQLGWNNVREQSGRAERVSFPLPPIPPAS